MHKVKNMKYIMGFVGLFLLSTCAWAAPETMLMYATLSGPIASFWEVETLGGEAVSMSEGTLELGVVSSDGAKGADGKINMKGDFYVETLRMFPSTTLVVGRTNYSTIWYLKNTLTLANKAEATFKGDLVIATLQLPSGSQNININGTLYLSSQFGNASGEIKVLAPNAQFSEIDIRQGNRKFHFEPDGDLSGKTATTQSDGVFSFDD